MNFLNSSEDNTALYVRLATFDLLTELKLVSLRGDRVLRKISKASLSFVSMLPHYDDKYMDVLVHFEVNRCHIR